MAECADFVLNLALLKQNNSVTHKKISINSNNLRLSYEQYF